MQARQMHHVHHTAWISYPVSFVHRFYAFVLGPLCVVALMYAAFSFYPLLRPAGEVMPFSTIVIAALYTFMRLLVAYVLAIIVAVPLALLATYNRMAETLLLPVFDIMESVPILALFPIIIMLFIQFNFLNGAAIFILFLAMLWNFVFTLVGGLKIIPKDIFYATRVFGLHGYGYARRFLLPALVPQLVTGSILAVAQGWNLIIVAEVLHTYIPGGTSAQDLFGIGSVLVAAAAHAQNMTFLASVFVMVIIIAALNFFVWQKLLHYSQRFRFE